MPECTHDCSTCGESCAERTEEFDFRAKANPNSNVKKVIAVMSGKGGVGKSLVTASLAAASQAAGKKAAVLDADITGPSIPKAFGIHERAVGNEEGILPALESSHALAWVLEHPGEFPAGADVVGALGRRRLKVEDLGVLHAGHELLGAGGSV